VQRRWHALNGVRLDKGQHRSDRAFEGGSEDIYFGPELPEGVSEKNWIKTISSLMAG
jgi:hypothetical protein